MIKPKKVKRHQGVVVNYDWRQGMGTIVESVMNIVFFYKDLPIKDGQFLVPEKGQEVTFDLVEDNYYGFVAKHIKFLNS